MRVGVRLLVIAAYLAVCAGAGWWMYGVACGEEREVVAGEVRELRLAVEIEVAPEVLPAPVPVPVREPTALELAGLESFPTGGAPGEVEDVLAALREAAEAGGARLDAEALLLVEGLQAEDFPAAVEAVLEIGGAGGKTALLAVLGRWAELQPEAAFDFAAAFFTTAERLEGLGAVLGGWASVDGAGALARLRQWNDEEGETRRGKRLPPKDAHELMKPLFFSWAEHDLAAAVGSAAGMVDDHEILYAWNGIGAAAADAGRREAALAAAGGLPDVEALEFLKPRLIAVGQIVGEWAEYEPAAAAAWVGENGYGLIDQGVLWHAWWNVAKRYLHHDPEAAAEWMVGVVETQEERDEASYAAALNWSRFDIDAAARWLDRTGPTDDSIQMMAERYAVVDLDQAMAWATRSSPGRLDETVAQTLAVALGSHDVEALVPHLGSGTLSRVEMAKKVGITPAGAQTAFE